MPNDYQIGGSLHVDASTYATRQADSELYEARLRKEFCYASVVKEQRIMSLIV